MAHTLPLKKHGSGKRRKVIIYILACILILGIVAGFTNTFVTDNRKFSAPWGATIVMEAEPPASGSPEDYDLISNLKFAAYRLHHARFFRGETNGKVVADIKLGSYTQNIHNTRYALGGNKVFAETISSSSLKSVAEQKYAEDGIIIYRPSTSISGSSATFSNSAYQMSYEEYSTKYGSVPNQLSKYIINEKTILGVNDENARYKQAANASETDENEAGGGFDFYVPENLVKGEDGYYRFSLTLDAFESTLYYRNEVRTLGGADQNPKFYSVRVTVTIDENWNPISVRSMENYDIAIPVLGAMNCEGDLTEVFTQIDDENGTIPEEDFFRPYVENAKSNPDYDPPDIPGPTQLAPSDYLATAFADYMTGEKPLDLKLDASIGDFSVYDVKLSMNLKTMDVRVALGSDMYVSYTDDKVYLNLNGINGYLTTADFDKLLKDERMAKLFGAFGGISTEKLFGGDMLTKLFENCVMTVEDGVAEIRLPFDIDLTSISPSLGKAHVDAAMYINDEDKSLKSITGKITALGKEINADIVPLRSTPRFPSTEGAVDLSPVLDFIPDAISTFTQKRFGIDGKISINGMDFGVSAYIDVENGIKADAVLSAFGLDISVKYADDTLLVALGDIKVKGGKDELPELLDAVLDLIDINKYTGLLSGFIPKSLNAAVGMVKTLDVSTNKLTLGLDLLSVPVNISLTRGGGYLTGLALDVKADLLGIKLDAAAELTLSHPEKRDVVIPTEGEFISVSALAALVRNVKPYLDENAVYTVSLGGSVEAKGAVYPLRGSLAIAGSPSLGISGRITALDRDVDIVYAYGVAYVSLGNIKIKLDTAKLDALISPAKELITLVKELSGATDGENVDVMQYIKRINVTQSGAIELTVGAIDITLDSATGRISVNGNIDGVKLNLGATLNVTQSAHNIKAPTDADAYAEIAELGAAVSLITDVVRQNELTASVEVIYNDCSYKADMSVSFADGVPAISVSEKTLPFEFVYTNGTAYISLGNIKLSGTAQDVQALLAAAGVRSDEIVSAVRATAESANIQEIFGKAVDAVRSLSVTDGIINAEIGIGDAIVNISAATDLSELTVLADVGGPLTATLRLGAGCEKITAPDGEFTAIADFLPLVQAATKLSSARAFELNYGVSLITGDANYTVTGDACIDVSNGIAAETNVTAFGATANIVYADNTVYLAIGNIKLALPVNSLDKLTAPIMALLEKIGVAMPVMPDLNEKVNSALMDGNVLEKLAGMIDIIKSLTVSDGTTTLTAQYADIYVTANITPETTEDNAKVTLALSVAINETEVTATVDVQPSEHTVTAPINAVEYSDVTELGETISALTEYIKSGCASFSAGVEIGGKTYTADVAISLRDGKLALSVKENTLPLDITVYDGTAYIAIGDVKLCGTLSDVTDLIDKIKANLPEIAEPYADKVAALIDKVSSTKLDIQAVIDGVLTAVTELSVKGGYIDLDATYGGASVTLGIATDLSSARANVTLSSELIKQNKDFAFAVFARDAAPTATIVKPDEAQYVPASELVKMLSPVIPLIKEKAFELTFDATVFDKSVTGDLYVNLGEYTLQSMQARLAVDIAGVPVVISLANKTAYLDINDGSIVLMQPLTKQGIQELISALDSALPDCDIAGKLAAVTDGMTARLTSLDIPELISKLSLAPADDGFTLTVTTNGKPIVVAVNTARAPHIAVTAEINGKALSISATGSAANGTIDGVKVNVDLNGTTFDTTVGIAAAESADVVLPVRYIRPIDLVKYVAPAMKLVRGAEGATSVSVDIDATIALVGKTLQIGGTVTLDFDPIAVSADLYLFSNTDKPQLLSVVYVDNELYIETGTIRLSFNTARDINVLYDSVKKYIPDYLKEIKNNLDALGGIPAMLNNIKKLAAVTDIRSAVDILFDTDNVRKTSLIEQTADMIELFVRDGSDDVTAGITLMDVPFALVVNATPTVSNAGDLDILVDTAFSNIMSLSARAAIEFKKSSEPISAPNNGEFVPVVTFVKTVLDAVNTLTAKAPDVVTADADGNTTTVSQTSFEIDEFTFKYDIFKKKTAIDENGNTYVVTDEKTKRPVIEKDASNNKIVEQHIDVTGKKDANGNAQKLLRFSLTDTTVKDTNGTELSKTSKIAIEAHLVLNILELNKKNELVAKNGFPIELDLYVAPTTQHPEGLAYLYYKEANGFGEKISIDYNSVMEIVAMVMDIVGADDATVNELLGDYRLPIDTSVFDSMSIAGFDSVRTILDGAVKALNEAKLALADAETAWDRFQNAGSVESLVDELTTDDAQTVAIKNLISSAIDHVKDAIAAFGSDDNAERETVEFNGALYEKVVTAVEFGTDGDTLFADVSNDIATGTSGKAKVSVTSTNDKINRIGVSKLDVNTAALDTFDMRFAPTQNITISIPSDFATEDTNGYKTMHADFSNIKHLLLDVMNTANLMEFDIGGLDTSDSIAIHLSLGADWLANLNLSVKYDVKVKIINVGDDADGNPIYKTAAAVEIHNEKAQLEILNIGSKIIVPDCTTRLFFYDDVLYVQGVKSWQNRDITVGSTTKVYTTSSRVISWIPRKTAPFTSAPRDWGDYTTTANCFEYVEVMYTVDEFFWMIQNDMNTFLNEFLFYLIPITTEKIAGQDIRGLISSKIGGSSTGEKDTSNKTLAKIFKRYSYSGGTHSLIIGLKELASSDSLGDLNLSITGANDGDANILDNYVSSLHIDTAIAGVITVDLDATLRNVALSSGGKEIYSKGFAPVDITLQNELFGFNGNSYIGQYLNYIPDTLYSVDGTLYAGTNNTLYTQNGSIVKPAFSANDSYTENKNILDIANEPDYVFGDTSYQNRFTHTLNRGYTLGSAYQYYIGTDANGNKYVYRKDGNNNIRVQVKSITGDVLGIVTRGANGKIASVENRQGGVQWTRPWKAAYDAVQKKAA